GHGRLRPGSGPPRRSGAAPYPRHPRDLSRCGRGHAARARGRRRWLHRQGRFRPGPFPEHGPATHRAGEARMIAMPMPRLRVLVVEDSLTVRKRMCEALAADGHIEVVGEASDGRQAVDLCMALRPDVVTMDMVLPVMSGLAATEHIMAHCPTPILVVSGLQRSELFRTFDALAAGALEVLEKPSG